MNIFRGELASTHPKFPKGSKAAVIEKADGPVFDKDQRIEYTVSLAYIVWPPRRETPC